MRGNTEVRKLNLKFANPIEGAKEACFSGREEARMLCMEAEESESKWCTCNNDVIFQDFGVQSLCIHSA